MNFNASLGHNCTFTINWCILCHFYLNSFAIRSIEQEHNDRLLECISNLAIDITSTATIRVLCVSFNVCNVQNNIGCEMWVPVARPRTRFVDLYGDTSETEGLEHVVHPCF